MENISVAEYATSADGTRLAFERLGSGPPLVVVSGALTDRRMVVPAMGALGAYFTIYAYDRRGRGESEDRQPYAPEREVEDVAAIIAAAGGRTFLFGHSSGACIALEAAAAGAGIRKVAAYEPPYTIDPERQRLTAQVEAEVRELVAAGRPGDAIALFNERAVGMPKEAIEAWRADPSFAMFEAIGVTLPHDLALGRGGVMPAQRLATIDVPALILGGEDSWPWMHDTVHAVTAAIPHASSRLLPGQTHGAAPEALDPVLREFFT
ncbi:MAG: alpha/beta hydrolase [Candidatus Dormiibacterota bacterium]